MVRRLSRWLLLFGWVLTAACKPIALDALGFQCTDDAACDEQTACIGGFCRPPWPGANNTGVPAGTTLRPSGGLVLDQPGAVVEGLDIQGCVDVRASGVTLRRSRIHCDDLFAVLLANGVSGVLFEDVELTGTAQYGISGPGGYTLRRANVHGFPQAIELGNDTVVEDSWVHELGSRGVRAVASGGGTHVLFRHNRVDSTGSPGQCVGLASQERPLSDVRIEQCLFDGGGYTVEIAKRSFEVSDVHLSDNRFGRSYEYGALTLDNCTAELSGNVYDDTGAPISQ